MRAARFLLLPLLIVILDLATPIVPMPMAFQWDDDEETTEVRRTGRQQRPREARPAPRPRAAVTLAAPRFPPTLARRDGAPGKWVHPPRRVQHASLDSVSSLEDH